MDLVQFKISIYNHKRYVNKQFNILGFRNSIYRCYRTVYIHFATTYTAATVQYTYISQQHIPQLPYSIHTFHNNIYRSYRTVYIHFATTYTAATVQYTYISQQHTSQLPYSIHSFPLLFTRLALLVPLEAADSLAVKYPTDCMDW